MVFRPDGTGSSSLASAISDYHCLFWVGDSIPVDTLLAYFFHHSLWFLRHQLLTIYPSDMAQNGLLSNATLYIPSAGWGTATASFSGLHHRTQSAS